MPTKSLETTRSRTAPSSTSTQSGSRSSQLKIEWATTRMATGSSPIYPCSRLCWKMPKSTLKRTGTMPSQPLSTKSRTSPKQSGTMANRTSSQRRNPTLMVPKSLPKLVMLHRNQPTRRPTKMHRQQNPRTPKLPKNMQRSSKKEKKPKNRSNRPSKRLQKRKLRLMTHRSLRSQSWRRRWNRQVRRSTEWGTITVSKSSRILMAVNLLCSR